MTVAAPDVAQALVTAWWTFRKAAGDDTEGWDTASASAEVRPADPLDALPATPSKRLSVPTPIARWGRATRSAILYVTKTIARSEGCFVPLTCGSARRRTLFAQAMVTAHRRDAQRIHSAPPVLGAARARRILARVDLLGAVRRRSGPAPPPRRQHAARLDPAIGTSQRLRARPAPHTRQRRPDPSVDSPPSQLVGSLGVTRSRG